LGLSFLASLVFAGMGLLVGCRAQNTQTVAGLVNLVSLPMFICSGVFFSSARFPDVVQPFIRVLPLTALNDGVREIMLDGAGLAALAPHFLILLIWGAVSFVVALRLFRWQ
jgi:ABC-2 type transport system permease protein